MPAAEENEEDNLRSEARLFHGETPATSQNAEVINVVPQNGSRTPSSLRKYPHEKHETHDCHEQIYATIMSTTNQKTTSEEKGVVNPGYSNSGEMVIDCPSAKALGRKSKTDAAQSEKHENLRNALNGPNPVLAGQTNKCDPEKISTTEHEDKFDKQRPVIATCSGVILHTLEEFFSNHGRRVAQNPLVTIATCVVTTLLLGAGVINFQAELRPFKLWLPQNSDFIKMLDWQNENFPSHFRRQAAIWVAPNVLTADNIREMWRVHELVMNLTEPKSGKTWEDICARIPSLIIGTPVPIGEEDDWELGTLEFRRKREVPDILDDISFTVSRETYCEILEDTPRLCYETGLLEIWGWNSETIMNLTDDQVIEDLNNATVSEVYGFKTNFSSYLGKIVTDEDGKIVSAGAATHNWISIIDKEAIGEGIFVVDKSSGQSVDVAGMAWEKLWLKAVTNSSERLGDTVLYANAASSFGTVSDDNIWGDVTFLIIGFWLMFAFVNFTLGRRNKVEQRPLLSLCGIFSVNLAIISSYGLCSAFNVKYTPVNSILPLLLIGLGVDDMFVIMAMWDNDTAKHKTSHKNSECSNDSTDDDFVEKAARTMKHAGVAITATSLTDVTAFAIGASTELPALRSFCIYASVGILIVFVLQSSLFLAFLILDEKRLRENRHGLFWCIKLKNWTPSNCSQVDLLNRFFESYGNLIMKDAARFVILIFTLILVIISVIGTSHLHQEFNPTWFIPINSYLADFFRVTKNYFQLEGAQSFFFFSNKNITENLPLLIEFIKDLSSAESVLVVNNWFSVFNQYVDLNLEFTNRTLSDTLFYEAISLFLYTATGGSYRNDMLFEETPLCNTTAPPLKYFRIPFKHRPADTPFLQQQATREIHNLLDKWQLPGYLGTWSEAYSVWETNAVVGQELLRNMILTGLVILAMTIVLLVSVRVALLVLSCVTATVLGVGASMYVFNLTIDTVSCISLVLSIGLSVDYSMHIAHSFLAEGSVLDKRKRASLAVSSVGPAVAQGGISTLIPFFMLAFSNSHVFITFFAVFTPTTILGLYYALVFLPVLLSFIGPEAYKTYYEADKVSATKLNGHSNAAFVESSDDVSSVGPNCRRQQ